MDETYKGSFYTIREEIGNAITHWTGAIFALIGTILMLIKTAEGNTRDFVACAIYGSTMIIMFSMSSLYHSITNVKAKKILRVLDHSSIFLLIAGTYTPFMLITLRGVLGWTIFGVVWITAVLGIILNLISVDRFKKISMLFYIASGWAVLFAIVPLAKAIEWQGTILLALGGVLYTVGIPFYKKKKIRYMHMIWHLFVLAGAVVHFLCIYLFVI